MRHHLRRRYGRSTAALPGELKSVLGTLAHNRSFKAGELREYLGFMRWQGTHIEVKSTTLLRQMVKSGLLQKVSGGKYFPTKEGWAWIEG